MSGEIIKREANTLQKLPPQEFNVCQVLHTFNQLRAFKLTGVEVLEWKDTIFRVRPDVDPLALACAIDGMITGKIPYDDRIGIKNIFLALERVVNEDGNYRILKTGIF